MLASLLDTLSVSTENEAAKEEEVGPRVISSFSEDLNEAFSGVGTIAIDAEGVDLSRVGQISIVQVSTTSCCFLIDVLDKDPVDPLVLWLKQLLENPDCTKIIHDCRMDSDALWHLLNIRLENVHDTSCWHKAISGREDSSLNDCLEHNNITPNVFRDSSVYKTNRSFWATRPLTQTMVNWAAGDVQCMFELYQLQLEQMPLGASAKALAKASSDKFLEMVREANVGFVVVKNPGRFIGKRGVNIRQLQRATSTNIYDAPPTVAGYKRNMFMVFYHSETQLARVRQAASR
jgi:hypothetical protein